MNKKLIMFLLFNLMLAVFLGLHLFYKGNNVQEATPTKVVTNSNPVVVSQPTVRVQIPIAQVSKTVEIPASVPVASKLEPLPNACTIYGPVTQDNKSILETLLQKANYLQNANIITKPIYEIYWNLGSNKNNAITLFEKQKNGGPLQNDKFKLKVDQNNDWIVPIAEITADENNAATITKELEEKASHVNAGGKWQYRAKENVYFYQFLDKEHIPKDIKDVMSKTLALPSASCQ